MSERRAQRTAARRGVSTSWSSRTMFVLASAGAVIGFNNFWQFPTLASQYGGGAFLIAYLLWVLVLALPLFTAQLMIARLGRSAPAASFREAAAHARTSSRWWIVGAVATVSAFLIFCALAVIAGWTLAFSMRAANGDLAHLTADGISNLFAQLIKDPEKQLFWFTAFIGMSAVVCARGLRTGIESVIRYAVPVMFSLMLLLLLYAATTQGFARALADVFMPDFSKLTLKGVLAAGSHAFFGMGLGTAALFAYGAYLDKDAPVMRLAGYVVVLDVAAAVVGALTVYGVLHAGDVAPGGELTLVFHALPLAFDHLMWGRIYLTAFFVMLALAAWLSGVAFFEPQVMWLVERFGWSRQRAATVAAAATWGFGLVCLLSFNAWAFSFPFFGEIKTFGWFDVSMTVVNYLLVPSVGIATAVFAGWMFRSDQSREQLRLRSPCAFDFWLWSTRLLVPAVLAWTGVTLTQLEL